MGMNPKSQQIPPSSSEINKKKSKMLQGLVQVLEDDDVASWFVVAAREGEVDEGMILVVKDLVLPYKRIWRTKEELNVEDETSLCWLGKIERKLFRDIDPNVTHCIFRSHTSPRDTIEIFMAVQVKRNQGDPVRGMTPSGRSWPSNDSLISESNTTFFFITMIC